MSKYGPDSWVSAVMKLEREGACRYCASHNVVTEGPLDPAHTYGRQEQDYYDSERGYWMVHEEAIIPLCRKHHAAYDAHELDIETLLTDDEAHRVLDAAQTDTTGAGLWRAVDRVSPYSLKKIPKGAV